MKLEHAIKKWVTRANTAYRDIAMDKIKNKKTYMETDLKFFI